MRYPCWLAMTQAICNLAGLPLVRNAFQASSMLSPVANMGSTKARFCHSMKGGDVFNVYIYNTVFIIFVKRNAETKALSAWSNMFRKPVCSGSPARNTVAITYFVIVCAGRGSSQGCLYLLYGIG